MKESKRIYFSIIRIAEHNIIMYIFTNNIQYAAKKFRNNWKTKWKWKLNENEWRDKSGGIWQTSACHKN